MTQVLQKLPIGIQDFEKVRRDGYIYVDKTKHVYNLVNRGSYYFLSRPRRFGKSLLMSTLKSYFEGKRELFKGLAIDSIEGVEWQPRPVLYLDLNTEKYDTSEKLNSKLDDFLTKEEQKYGRATTETSFGLRFEGIIRRAREKTGHRVAILVDEYDKPMLQAIGNEELQDEFRSTLKGFYGALKSMDGCIKFAMLTGVTKFVKVSVFSDLNNLNDIIMDVRYYDICGMTEEELSNNFSAHIDALAEANGMMRQACIEELRRMYDGYHFEETAPGVYNPFSVLNTFDRKKFSSYWFETGTPTYLVEMLRRYDYNLEQLENVETDAFALNSIDEGSKSPVPVIYQSGYLTIKGYDKEFGLYRLGYPNAEVREGFLNFLVPYYTSIDRVNTSFQIQQFVKEVRNGECEKFVLRLKSFFAGVPYEMVKDLENHYQNVLFIIFRLVGFYTHAEYHTSCGRIDMLVESRDYRYVMEFKLDGTAEEALQQIKTKDYALPFAVDGKKTFLVGMNFSRETRNIERYIIEPAE